MRKSKRLIQRHYPISRVAQRLPGRPFFLCVCVSPVKARLRKFAESSGRTLSFFLLRHVHWSKLQLTGSGLLFVGVFFSVPQNATNGSQWEFRRLLQVPYDVGFPLNEPFNEFASSTSTQWVASAAIRSVWDQSAFNHTVYLL